MSDAVNTFFDAWSVTDTAARRDMLVKCLADTVSYADPRSPDALTDADAINDYVGMFAASAPGATAKVVKSDERFGTLRTTIAFEMPGGMVQHGQYFIDMTDDKITRLVGFVGTGTPE